MNATTNKTTTLVGSLVRLRFERIDDIITFKAKIVREDADTVVVRIPERIRKILFTAFPNAAYRFPKAKAIACLIK